MSDLVLDRAERAALDRFADDLRRLFDARLQAIVAYGRDQPRHTLVVMDHVSFDDLARCAPEMDAWHAAGLATPLLLSRDELMRTLDVFPLEYDAIIREHVVVLGRSPLEGCEVSDADVRRAIERQARGHLIHLREGFLEADGQPGAVARLMTASLPAFRALVENLDQLDDGGLDARARSLIAELSSMTTIADPTALFARYVAAVDAIWSQVDRWRLR
jgi:hypothetical protein